MRCFMIYTPHQTLFGWSYQEEWSSNSSATQKEKHQLALISVSFCNCFLHTLTALLCNQISLWSKIQLAMPLCVRTRLSLTACIGLITSIWPNSLPLWNSSLHSASSPAMRSCYRFFEHAAELPCVHACLTRCNWDPEEEHYISTNYRFFFSPPGYLACGPALQWSCQCSSQGHTASWCLVVSGRAPCWGVYIFFGFFICTARWMDQYA